jgi:hypothetical protein
MGSGPNDEGLSRHHLIEGCEAWLRRLHTNHIDLYQVHEWDGMTSREETLAALQALIDSGKVRYVGVSNYAAWQLMKALRIAARAPLPSLLASADDRLLTPFHCRPDTAWASLDLGTTVVVEHAVAARAHAVRISFLLTNSSAP